MDHDNRRRISGKTCIRKENLPDVTWADGAVCTEEELYSCEGIYHFHQYIERKIKEGEPIDDLAEETDFGKNRN